MLSLKLLYSIIGTVMKVQLKELGNEFYKVLEYMKCAEITHGNDKIIIHTQQEIADDLRMSKLKTNKIIRQLFYLGLLKHYTKKVSIRLRQQVMKF